MMTLLCSGRLTPSSTWCWPLRVSGWPGVYEMSVWFWVSSQRTCFTDSSRDLTRVQFRLKGRSTTASTVFKNTTLPETDTERVHKPLRQQNRPHISDVIPLSYILCVLDAMARHTQSWKHFGRAPSNILTWNWECMMSFITNSITSPVIWTHNKSWILLVL